MSLVTGPRQRGYISTPVGASMLIVAAMFGELGIFKSPPLDPRTLSHLKTWRAGPLCGGALDSARREWYR